MASIGKWITRSSVGLLALASASAFAGAPAPEYTVHSASVKLKVSEQGEGKQAEAKFDNFNVNSRHIQNDIMDRDPDFKLPKNEQLALVVPCDTEDDELTLTVYDEDTSEDIGVNPLVFTVLGATDEEDKNGILKRSKVIVDNESLLVTGEVKIGKIGKKVAGDAYDPNALCASGFSSRSVSGGAEGSLVMSGTISASKARYAFDVEIVIPAAAD